MHNGRVPLVEGPLVVNECSSRFLIKSRRILRKLGQLHWLDVRAEHQPIRGPLGTTNCKTDQFGPSTTAHRLVRHALRQQGEVPRLKSHLPALHNLLRGILGNAPNSRWGLKNSFWRFHGNHRRISLDLLIHYKKNRN